MVKSRLTRNFILIGGLTKNHSVLVMLLNPRNVRACNCQGLAAVVSRLRYTLKALTRVACFYDECRFYSGRSNTRKGLKKRLRRVKRFEIKKRNFFSTSRLQWDVSFHLFYLKELDGAFKKTIIAKNNAT